VYNCEYGFFSASANGRTGGDIYMIGNIIYNLSTNRTDSGIWGYRVGIELTDDENATKYVLNNIIFGARGGIFNTRGTGSLAIVNNIIAGMDGEHIWIDSSVRASKSSINNTLFDETAKIKWGDSIDRNISSMQSTFGECIDCIESDPLFVDSANNDYHLQSASPAIDTGTSSGVVQQVFDTFQTLYGIDIRNDIEGNPRIGTWDIGAYEGSPSNLNYPGLAISNITEDENVTLTFTVSATDPDSDPLTDSVQNTPNEVGGQVDLPLDNMNYETYYSSTGNRNGFHIRNYLRERHTRRRQRHSGGLTWI
jgi:hypothetical protein